MRIWKTWDEEEKASAVRIAGLCVTALTVFILIATVSYLFSWKQDMSLLTDKAALKAAEDVGNAAGKLGLRTGHLLVCELFGLGSLSLLIILTAISVRLLAHKWSYSLVKTTLIAVFGAFISSLLLAFCGKIAGLPYIFGGGLGGRCGAFVVQWACLTLGDVVCGIFIVILIAAFLFFSSRRFNRWVAGLGRNDPDEEIGNNPAPAPAVQEPEPVVVLPEPPVVTPEPEPVPVQEAVKVETEEKDKEKFEVVKDDSLDVEVTKDLKPINNRLDPPEGLPKFNFPPPLDLLKDHSTGRREVSTEELTRNNNKIRAALANYKIQITDVKAIVGPTVTLYKVTPAPGVKIADIKRVQEDIGMSLNAQGVRVVTLSDSVGIEVANDFASIVPLKKLLNDSSFRESKFSLPIAIGYTITQKVKVFDLADAPHLLIAGATKQGKSVGLNVIVSSLLYSKHPSELKFVFIDPKMVEFTAYAKLLKHYLAVLPDAGSEEEEKAKAIFKKAKEAERALRSLCIEMDERYELLSKAEVNNVILYNNKYKDRHLRPDKGHRFMPYLVVIIDEYADLTMSSDTTPEAKAASRSITNSIMRLAQKGRAAGIHLIIATQRPSVNVVSGVLKANFPMKIAFRVSSRVDSMTILDSPGADKLIGRGDMLLSEGLGTERIQCAYIDGTEIHSINNFIAEQTGYGKCYNTPYYLPAVDEAGAEGSGGMVDIHNLDERFEEAARMVVTTQKGSTSDLQRKLGMGYAKAGRVMDQLEAAGIVGPQEGSKPRQVLVPDLNTLQSILDAYMK